MFLMLGADTCWGRVFRRADDRRASLPSPVWGSAVPIPATAVIITAYFMVEDADDTQSNREKIRSSESKSSLVNSLR